MAYLRFQIPEYDFQPFKNLSWEAPSHLNSGEIDKIVAARGAGEADALGCFPVQADESVFANLNIRGEHCHAVLCATPSTTVHLLGRSYAWWNQRVLVLDSLDPQSMNIVHDWRTPRPMNNRLGPDYGIDLAGGIYYVISSHMYDDHWIGNRTIMDNDWDGGDASDGFRILGASKDDANEFCECNLSFSWDD